MTALAADCSARGKYRGWVRNDRSPCFARFSAVIPEIDKDDWGAEFGHVMVPPTWAARDTKEKVLPFCNFLSYRSGVFLAP